MRLYVSCYRDDWRAAVSAVQRVAAGSIAEHTRVVLCLLHSAQLSISGVMCAIVICATIHLRQRNTCRICLLVVHLVAVSQYGSARG